MQRVLALLLILAEYTVLAANPANGDPRKEKLFSMFIAPCCWRENLLAHHSPKADELRAEIVSLMTAGQTDSEIKQRIIKRHSLRILAIPEGGLGRWLWCSPVFASALGVALVALFIRRSLRMHGKEPRPATAMYMADAAESEWI